MKTELLQGYDVLVVGSGAAGFNAACHVAKEGCKTVALVTEGVRLGTSRNTGSDKQTYYKLGLSGDSPDSVRKMAEDLYTGGCVDGDNALCEAALSARCFLNLCELGVAFPVNRYGEYIGYQTDHDTFARATSAGPLTSKFMTEALEQQAAHLNIPVLDGLQVVELVKNESGICGVICIEINSGDLSFIPCGNVILATGGPAGVYSDSVYPICHTGSSSLALDCGAHFQNMTYWQYGLSSVTPRWNVSGTYMQVLPRFVSVDANGTQHEFLLDYFNDPYDALSAVFLKGYQWPFDSNKVPDGSSVIDLAVYNECVSKNRKVYLDYTKNPFGFFELDYSKLSADAQTYLQNANACFGTPIARLQLMNQPAIDLYKNKGVDLTKQMLQIALCAQHHNGGISVDMWWHTCVDGLFACGECAGTHGVARPGGSALNAGQVGALRAALNASHNDRIAPKPDVSFVNDCLGKHRSFTESILRNPHNVNEETFHAQKLMSRCGSAIRCREVMEEALAITCRKRQEFDTTVGVSEAKHLHKAYKLLDIYKMQEALLFSMLDYEKQDFGTSGSALYGAETGISCPSLGKTFRFQRASSEASALVQELYHDGKQLRTVWRPVRPLPQADDFFENVWRQYRQNKNIY